MLKYTFSGILSYNNLSKRYCIGDLELHCGDSFYLRCCGCWYKVTIEMDHSFFSLGHWYFLPLNSPSPESCIGLPARIIGDFDYE